LEPVPSGDVDVLPLIWLNVADEQHRGEAMSMLVKNTLISINVLYHPPTKMLVATSPELKGLIVHARSEEEINERVPLAIRLIMEADGYIVESVTPVDGDESPAPAGFVATPRKFQAIAA
jgi:hypothetical protein